MTKRLKTIILSVSVTVYLFAFNEVNAFNLFSNNPANPLDETQIGTGTLGGTFRENVINLTEILLSVIGAAALLFVVYGGMVYLTSGSNEKRTEEAKKIIFSAIVGFALSALAFVILKLAESLLALT